MEIISADDYRQRHEVLATIEGSDDLVVAQSGGRPRFVIDGRRHWLFPDTTGRKVILVAGASGSGKSFFIRNYAMMWKQTHRDAPVYLFSSKQEDPSLDKNYRPDYGVVPGKLRLRQVTLDEQTIGKFTEQSIQHQFANSLCVFDDVLLTNKKFQDHLDR
jgi:hypothetical protein